MPPFRLTPPSQPNQRDVTRQIGEFLEHNNWYVVRNHVGTFVSYSAAVEVLNLLIEALLADKEPDLDAVWTRVNSPVVTIGEKGMPDLLAMNPDYLPLWVGIKPPGFYPTEHELTWADRMKLRGFRVRWFDSLEGLLKRYRTHVALKKVS
jgi:hypothetical protein